MFQGAGKAGERWGRSFAKGGISDEDPESAGFYRALRECVGLEAKYWVFLLTPTGIEGISGSLYQLGSEPGGRTSFQMWPMWAISRHFTAAGRGMHRTGEGQMLPEGRLVGHQLPGLVTLGELHSPKGGGGRLHKKTMLLGGLTGRTLCEKVPATVSQMH